MMVKPKWRWRHIDHDGRLDILPSRVDDGLFIECEAVNPPSAVGRTVTLWVDNEHADAMLLALREHGIERRRLVVSE